VTSLYLAIVSFTSWRHTHRVVTPLVLTPATEGFPLDNLHEFSHGGRWMAKVQNGVQILPLGADHNKHIIERRMPTIAE